MANTEAHAQPTGSSKRKRKFSVIKRNVFHEDTQETNKEPDNTIVDKPSAAKKKQSFGKKEGAELKLKKFGEFSCVVDAGSSRQSELESSKKSEEIKRRVKVEDSSEHSYCENCSLCSEHKALQIKEMRDDSKTKKKLYCHYCEKEGHKRGFLSSGKLKIHMKLAHQDLTEEVMKFECKLCTEPVWFATKSKYCYHLGAKHPGIVQFVCEICTESFKMKANYKNHLATHNIVVNKKFTCEVCNGTFVNKAGYDAHKKRFPGPHIHQVCEHCGFSFSKARSHINHRCKKLLTEEAERQKAEAAATAAAAATVVEKMDGETIIEVLLPEIVDKEVDVQNNAEKQKKVVQVQRLVPRKGSKAVYRPVQIQTEEVASEPLIVHEYQQIEEPVLTTDNTQPIIVQDLTGQFVNSNQILQFDFNQVETEDGHQVYQDANRLHLFLWDDDTKRLTPKKTV